MRVGFYTLGCKVNQYETEALKEKFALKSYDVVPENAEADIYVINTCTVTSLADRKSRQFIRRAKSINPEAVIAVTGCYAEVDPDKVGEISGVDIIAGTEEKNNLLNLIEGFIAENDRKHNNEMPLSQSDKHAESNPGGNSEISNIESDIVTGMEGRTRAYIKIQEGCDRYCTYCIIPYARGRLKSRSHDEIVREANGLIDGGYKEIVLTGINTALYGKDRGEFGLTALLKALDEIPGDFRIRLSSLEPTVIDPGDVEGILESKRLCRHLHLSIQSGSDKILKEMNRKYTAGEYMEIVSLLRKRDPSFGITTDIIVGFPGEDEEDFMDSVNLVKEACFTRVHVFRYSPRKGTPAADMEGQVPAQEKKKRGNILSQVAEETAKEFCLKEKGGVEKVLWEEIEGGLLTGYSDNYIRVYAEGNGDMLNSFSYVKLNDIYKDGMKGEIIDG